MGAIEGLVRVVQLYEEETERGISRCMIERERRIAAIMKSLPFYF